MTSPKISAQKATREEDSVDIFFLIFVCLFVCLFVCFTLTSYFTDMPGMGVYFFSYEWILNKLTLEGERFVSIIMLILNVFS